jgi:hypothetical protein
MKIDPNRRVDSASLRKAGRAGSASSTEFSKLLDAAGEADHASGTAPAAPVDALLAAQEVGEGGGGGKKARQRAEQMLAKLEAIRDGLLLGVIPQAQLRELAASAKATREGFVDPQLTEVLDDIELRARVELAKLGFDA